MTEIEKLEKRQISLEKKIEELSRIVDALVKTTLIESLLDMNTNATTH